MAKVLKFQLQHQSFNEHSGLISFKIDWLDLLASKGLSRVFCITTVWKYIFFGIQPSLKICLKFRRPGFNSWVNKMTWRRKQQPTPVFLPGESHGRGAWQATDHGVARVGHVLVTKSPPFSLLYGPNSHICTWLLNQRKKMFTTQIFMMVWSLT